MAFIDAHRHEVVDGKELGVEPICSVLSQAGLQVAASPYYAAKTRPPSARSKTAWVRNGFTTPRAEVARIAAAITTRRAL